MGIQRLIKVTYFKTVSYITQDDIILLQDTRNQ